jgi:hypothetical protein
VALPALPYLGLFGYIVWQAFPTKGGKHFKMPPARVRVATAPIVVRSD